MNAVLTDAGDVRIALRAQQAMVTGQNRQQEGGEHRPLVGGVVADVMEWAVLHPGIEYAARLQEVDEEWQLSQGGDRGRWVPLDVDTASEGVHRNWFLGLQGLPFCVTLRESSARSSKSPQTGVWLSFVRLGGEVNCGFLGHTSPSMIDHTR